MITTESKKSRLDLHPLAAVVLVMVFATSALGTKYIRDDVTGGDATSIGTWDWPTKTCTLTTDLSETVQIVNDGITLDGNGHTVIGPGIWSGHGVYLYERTGVTVKNVNIQQFYFGINLYMSSNNTLTDNTTSNNSVGIRLFRSSDNTLNGNIANSNNWHGIQLKLSSYNTLTGNSMSGNRYNFRVEGWEDAHFDNSIDTSNTVDGKPVYYLNGITGGVYDISTNAGIFYAINCNGITIKDLLLTNNYEGVYLRNTHNSSIENVVASNNWCAIYLDSSTDNSLTGNTTSNNTYGIILHKSSYNNLTGNTISNNFDGIYLCLYCNNNTLTGNTVNSNNWSGIFLLDNCSNNTLTGNTISNNGYGIHLYYYSNGNQIYNNNFIDNMIWQAYVSGGSGNVFNLDPPVGGNYWNDWCPPLHPDVDGDGFVDSPYVIVIDAGLQDNLPWVRENGWAITPQEAIEQLIVQVAGLNLQKGIDNSLDAKLDAAFKALDDVNENNDVAAINSLNAFINAVEAQRGNKISDSDADALIAAVQLVIDLLEEE